jgi:hypothetical protein
MAAAPLMKIDMVNPLLCPRGDHAIAERDCRVEFVIDRAGFVYWRSLRRKRSIVRLYRTIAERGNRDVAILY